MNDTPKEFPVMVLRTLEQCLELVTTIHSKFRPYADEDEQYSNSGGKDLIHSIQSAIEIVKHEAVQLPRSEKEAKMMKHVAMWYLGEIKIEEDGK